MIGQGEAAPARGRPLRTVRAGELTVHVFRDSDDLGRAAARRAAAVIHDAVRQRGAARVVLATGNSQLSFVRALAAESIPWPAVTVFHMDEYLGIGSDHPASFRRWIRERIAEPYAPAAVAWIDGDAPDADAECARYEKLLRAAPLDLVCMGIGENGHLAFNEPDEADFTDPLWVRVVGLSSESRQQQVGEGHFAAFCDVPEAAISLTVPALLAARTVQVTVPERRKAAAVRAALHDPVSPACPATVLREAAHASLWLDLDSAAKLDELVE